MLYNESGLWNLLDRISIAHGLRDGNDSPRPFFGGATVDSPDGCSIIVLDQSPKLFKGPCGYYYGCK